MSDSQQKSDAINRFIDLANVLTAEGSSAAAVSSGLMTACAIFATYVVTGNDGALRESGVEKITKLFGEELSAVQRAKINQAKQSGMEMLSE